MSPLGKNHLFAQVRSKLGLSPRSSMILSPSPAPVEEQQQQQQHDAVQWEELPLEYQPVDRAAVRVVPGHQIMAVPLQTSSPPPLAVPTPRPRTTSAPSSLNRAVKLQLDTETFVVTSSSSSGRPRQPAREERTPWPPNDDNNDDDDDADDGDDGDDDGSDKHDETRSFEIAAALPPEHLDPPPPYSLPPPPPPPPQQLPSTLQTRRHSYLPYRPPSQPPLDEAVIQPYDPRRYASRSSDGTSRRQSFITDVPTIRVPEPPTPVSPINTLDLQYLALRRSDAKVTIDGLLSHPMLQRPG